MTLLLLFNQRRGRVREAGGGHNYGGHYTRLGGIEGLRWLGREVKKLKKKAKKIHVSAEKREEILEKVDHPIFENPFRFLSGLRQVKLKQEELAKKEPELITLPEIELILESYSLLAPMIDADFPAEDIEALNGLIEYLRKEQLLLEELLLICLMDDE
jgi:hypothetical protein